MRNDIHEMLSAYCLILYCLKCFIYAYIFCFKGAQIYFYIHHIHSQCRGKYLECKIYSKNNCAYLKFSQLKKLKICFLQLWVLRDEEKRILPFLLRKLLCVLYFAKRTCCFYNQKPNKDFKPLSYRNKLHHISKLVSEHLERNV